MAYDINTALERLESNLAEVASAKNQVEATIASSESLQQVIRKYSDNLQSLHNEISSFIEEIHNFQSMKTEQLFASIEKIKASCQYITNDFENSVNEATDGFEAKVATVIQNIKSENQRQLELLISSVGKVKNACECITSNFKKSIDNITDDFETKAAVVIKDFKSENDKLSGQVNKLISIQDILIKATNKVNEVKDNVDVLASDLKSSQDEQDKDLANIKSSLEVLPSKIKSYKEAIISTIDNQTSYLKAENDDFKAKLSQVTEKLDNIIFVLNETKNVCSKIDKKVESMESTFNLRMINTEKSVNINKWILIVGIIVLVILHFI